MPWLMQRIMSEAKNRVRSRNGDSDASVRGAGPMISASSGIPYSNSKRCCSTRSGHRRAATGNEPKAVTSTITKMPSTMNGP